MRFPSNHIRSPGNGADRPDETHRDRQYVYVARSRRAGGLSLGIDLTPDGHCGFSCIYCQATHLSRRANRQVDVLRVRDDLQIRLRQDKGELRDIVLAGSGEPTSVPNLGDALTAIQDTCLELGVAIPQKIFTNGRHLGTESVRSAVSNWCRRGGQVWVKLDGASAKSVKAINGRSFDVDAHMQGVWSFALEHQIGLQTMLLIGPGIDSPESIVAEVVGALKEGLTQGAQVSEVHLLTLSRRPSDETAARVLRDLSEHRLEELAGVIRRQTGLGVRVFPK